ncbi:MAG: sodium:proton antiporter [Acidobacteriota bacterium]|nr:sodium:proton antiporter [Acidobacteriota bacterium]
MGHTIEIAEFLLLVAAVVAVLARRIHVPYSVGLVLAGIALAFVPFSANVPLTKDLIFTTLLPPLVFEAAFQLPWKPLRRDLPVILLLATLGVVLAAALTAAGMHYISGWTWMAALVFGVLIAATDPVSVIATFKESGVRGRLRLLVEAESLFNDGTAAVAFGIVVARALGQHFTAFDLTRTLVITAGGGILSGAAVAGAVLLLAGPATDHLVELAFTTVAAYGSFLLAEHFHLSGILATVTTGMMLGNLGPLGAITDKGREAVEAFWEFAAFVANSLVFLLLGLHLAQQHFASVWRPAAAAIAIVLLGRAVAVYPCCWLFSRSALRVEAKHQHLLFWGGLRGALALALALGLPAELPGREEIITVSFAVVAASIFMQGLTMPPLLRKLGELTSRLDKPAA